MSMVTKLVFFGILILLLHVNAAPSDVSKLDDIAKIEEEDLSPDDKTYTLEDEKNDNNDTTQGQRQKRWYNYYGYGFPPVNPIVYANNVKRDESSDTGVYGIDDPFNQIYRRLQEIAIVVRQQPSAPPPPRPLFPIFFPVIYIPQIGCGCTPVNTTIPSPQPTNATDGTSPDIFTRFPEMEDNRQNWGFLVNDTESDEDGEENAGRPISFDPVPPKRPVARPPPPVEHGSIQASSQNQLTTTTTTTIRPTTTTTQNVPNLSPDKATAPNACDGAVLSCCHQSQVTYDCFASQGCPDPTSYGNPCDANVILRVIDKFQKFYGQRTV